MKVLVFAPLAHSETPFDQWLSDLDLEYFVLAPRRTRKSYAHFKNFQPFVRYWSNQEVEQTGHRLAREHEFAAVLVKDEWDVLRAARVRESSGVPGQSLASATVFRDKVAMKTQLAKAGIAVARFAPIATGLEALTFARANGFPVVIKPIDGVAGAHTHILRDAAALDAYLTNPLPPGLMIESFVAGSLYHVDGLAGPKGVQFAYSSRYVNSCLSFQKGEFSGSISLKTEDPLNQRLVEFTDRILKAMPPVERAAVHGFHAEIFVTPANELVCCEVACRVGGGRIVEQTQTEFGVNLDREVLRGQMGLASPVTQATVSRTARRFGHMFIPHGGKGLVKRLPVLGRWPWARLEKSFVAVGEQLEMEEGRRQNLASCLIEGESEAQVESRMREWNEWFLSETEIDESEASP